MGVIKFSKGNKTALICSQLQLETLMLLAPEPGFYFSLCVIGAWDHLLTKHTSQCTQQDVQKQKMLFQNLPMPSIGFEANEIQCKIPASLELRRTAPTDPTAERALMPSKHPGTCMLKKSLSRVSLGSSIVPSSSRAYAIPRAEGEGNGVTFSRDSALSRWRVVVRPTSPARRPGSSIRSAN